MTGMRVVVTGGAGYIGSHVCKELARAGLQPIAIDNLERGHAWAVKWGPLVTLDLLDTAALTDALAAAKPAAVLHFAAYAYIHESVLEPRAYYRNNVGGTLSLLEAMARAGCDTLVFSSTCATYGIPPRLPVDEDQPQMPINPYGRSKLMVEQILEEEARARGLRYVALRYFNAAGADPDGEIGEVHIPEPHLIPSVLQAAAGLRPAVDILGGDYDTPDGTCIRDYIHVSDLADAHLRALRWLLDGNGSRCFNLGNGAGFSVRQVIDTARAVTGLDIPVTVKPRRPGDPPNLVGDAARAIRDLGWAPRRPGLEQQVEDAWRWLRQFHL